MNIESWKTAKKDKKMTFDRLSELSGVAKRTLEDIFSGKTLTPRIDTVQAIEAALGISEPKIKNEIPMSELDMYPIPLLGSVVAGVPIEAQEDLEGYIYINYRPTEEYFALRVHGDSMKNVGIQDKSIVVCHKQNTADSGDIVVAMLNGEQTVKRFKIHSDKIYLMPENPDFYPIPVTEKDDLIILGKVIEVRFAF